jgi:hypothetical protein
VTTDQFWRFPPWHGGCAKQRLGLKPVLQKARVGTEWLNPAGEDCRIHKQRILDSHYPDAVASVPGSEAAQNALANLVSISETVYPDVIAGVAMGVEDDLCLLEAVGEQRLIAACICSPSYWRLQDKIGAPLWDVHAPVQGMNDKIGHAISRFIECAPAMQVFERNNWFLHGDPAPFHLQPEAQLSADVETWYVRSERQTLCRITENCVLFTIGVRCEPLKSIRNFNTALDDLLVSLRTMDRGEIEHFGGTLKHGRLVKRLLQWSSEN